MSVVFSATSPLVKPLPLVLPEVRRTLRKFETCLGGSWAGDLLGLSVVGYVCAQQSSCGQRFMMGLVAKPELHFYCWWVLIPYSLVLINTTALFGGWSTGLGFFHLDTPLSWHLLAAAANPASLASSHTRPSTHHPLLAFLHTTLHANRTPRP